MSRLRSEVPYCTTSQKCANRRVVHSQHPLNAIRIVRWRRKCWLCAAVVFSMVRFDTYIYSKEVTVQSDHRPLMAIVKKSLTSAPRRLQRMLLRLQRYNYTIVYVPGSQMVIADSCPEHICRTLRRQSSRRRSLRWRTRSSGRHYKPSRQQPRLSSLNRPPPVMTSISCYGDR